MKERTTQHEPNGLSENHRRSLHVVLTRLEETVDEIEARLEAGHTDFILYRVANPYTSDEEDEIRHVVEEIRAALRDCRDRWGLRPQTRNLGAEIKSVASVIWADLIDTTSRKMRRYGEIPNDTAKRLDRDIDRLIGLVTRLMDVHSRRTHDDDDLP